MSRKLTGADLYYLGVSANRLGLILICLKSTVSFEPHIFKISPPPQLSIFETNNCRRLTPPSPPMLCLPTRQRVDAHVVRLEANDTHYFQLQNCSMLSKTSSILGLVDKYRDLHLDLSLKCKVSPQYIAVVAGYIEGERESKRILDVHNGRLEHLLLEATVYLVVGPESIRKACSTKKCRWPTRSLYLCVAEAFSFRDAQGVVCH